MDRDNTTILIDGYNYIGTINGIVAQRLRMQRDGLIKMLDRYYRKSGIKVIVVFDSREEVVLTNKSNRPGITVKFTPPGNKRNKADDWIIANLNKISGIVGVITNDRELRHRIEKKNAFWVSCEEFKQAVEAFYMEHPEPEAPGPEQNRVLSDAEQVRIEERDSGVWDMFLSSADVKPLHGDKRVKASKKTTDSATAMIEAMTRVTDHVIREKEAGMGDDSKRNALSREKIFRNKQISFLKLLRGIGG